MEVRTGTAQSPQMRADGPETVSRWADGIAVRILRLIEPFFIAMGTMDNDLETARNGKKALYKAFLARYFNSVDIARFDQGSRFARHISIMTGFYLARRPQ